jgi:Protein of unknown function (DUF1571)
MVPAMDRTTSTPERRFWLSFGLGLAFCAGNSGCAQIKTQIWGDSTEPAQLGQIVDTNDSYAMAHRTRGANPVPGPLPIEAGTTASVLAQVEEVGAAIRPAEPATDPAVSGVALQPPMPIDGRTTARLASSTSGVPNASKILASSERRPEAKATPRPADIISEARAALDAMTSYQVAIHRQERVNGALLPEEDLVLAIRRAPRAVRLTWEDGPNKGREVLYRADEPGGQMHVKMANPALPRLALDPESPMVMRNSRHPVTEAGFDSLVEGLENALNAPAASGISYAGLETPAGRDRPAHLLTRTSPSGEKWRVFIDTQTHLPTIVQAVDSNGELLERYLFHDLRTNPLEIASADAFDPVARWGQSKGLFGRLTGNAGGGEAPGTDPTPR